MENIKIEDRTKSLDFFKIQELEDLMNKFLNKGERNGGYKSLDLVITGPKNPAKKVITYEMKLHATTSSNKKLIYNTTSYETRAGLQDLLSKLTKIKSKEK